MTEQLSEESLLGLRQGQEVEASTAIEPMLVTIQRTDGLRSLEMNMLRTQIVANAVVVAGLVIAGLTYWNDRSQRKIEAASVEVQALRSSELSSARSALLSLWTDRDLSALQGQIGAAEKEILVAGLFDADRENGGSALEALIEVADYFDRVELCVEADRCDRSVIDRQLGPYAHSFQCLYGGQIRRVRDPLLLTTLGDGLQRLAEKMGDCEQLQANG